MCLICLQGSARRKKKVVHRTATADDKKLQSSLKKLAVNNIAGIEEVNILSFLPWLTVSPLGLKNGLSS